MNRGLALFVIGLIFGGGFGFVLAAGSGVTFDGHDHGDATQHSDAADHQMNHGVPLEVSRDTAPTVQMTLTKDLMEGYNLHLMVDGFDFAPQQASLDHVPGQGHAHVYVNGVKQARVYGPWMHLATLPKGNVTVEVTLNSNNHQPLAVDGKPIMASSTVTVE